jgi:hypothetical protein
MTEFSQAMRREARTLALRGTVTYPGGDIRAFTGSDVASFSISEGNEGGILPGDVLSACCQMILDNAGGRWAAGGALRGAEPLAGASFALELGVFTDGDFLYSPLGTFVCDAASADENGATVSLTLYDTLYSRAAGAFEDSLGYPRTLSEIWAQLCGRATYMFSGTVPGGDRIVDWPPAWGEISVRAAMGFAAAVCGCFVRIGRAGGLELVPLVSAEAATSIPPETYLSRKKLDASFGPVNAIKVTTVNDREEDDAEPYDISIGPEGAVEACVLQVTGNPLFVTGGAHTRAMAEGMLSALNGLSYAACRFVWRGDPTLLPGAKLSVVGVGGETTECVLSRQTLKFDGGFSADCVSGAPDVAVSAKEITPAGGVKAGQIIGVVRGANIAASAITASKIAAGAVVADKIMAGSVLADKIAAGAVHADKISAGAVTAEKIGAGAVEADKIAAGAVHADKISAGAVTAEKIGAGAVEADKIAAGAVTADKIAAGAVTADSVAAGSITADRCAAGMIAAGTGLIADGAIGSAQIADASITDAKIVGLTASKITAGTLDAANINVTNLNADNIVAGTINGQRIPALGTDKITDGAVTADKLGNGAVTADKIVAQAVTADKLAASSVTANKLAAGAVTAAKIDVADLFAATAAVDAVKTMQVASLRNGSALELNETRAAIRTPEFLVEISGAEEGEEKLRIGADGAYMPQLDSPTVARRVPGGVYSVGAGCDYDTLADAFADLEGAALDADAVLKVAQNDPGGVLRGVRGGRVIIVPRNLLDRAAVYTGNATFASDGSYGVKITASSAGTYRLARMLVGRVGDLGLAGKAVTLGVGTIAASGATLIAVAMYLTDADYASNMLYLGGLTAQNTSQTVYIPVDTDDDRMLVVSIFVSGSTSCPAGAYVIYDQLHVEVGNSEGYLYPSQYSIASLVLRDNARVHLVRDTFPSGISVRDGNAVIHRCAFYGAIGVDADLARVRMYMNSGACTKAVRAGCASVYVAGTAPGGTYTGWLIDATNATISSSGSAGSSVTKTLTAISTGTYSTFWWSSDRAVRQGYSSSNGALRGGVWFDMTGIPAGAAVSAMTLTLTRAADVGVGDSVTVKAYGTSSGARSGAPALTSSGYALGEILNGKTKTFNLPAAQVAGLADGSYKGIVLRADDTSVLPGKTYSGNYAKFGGTDGTAPKLAATYTT